MALALELRGVEKSFPGVRALAGVSFKVAAGEVHALVGENGAGKSTLIKIASGVLQPDAGEIFLGDELVQLTPSSAKQKGIRVLHQERQIALTRTVADNVVLDAPPRNRFGFVTRAAVHREAQRRLDRVGISLDLDAPAWTLRVAQLQLLELARAVDFDAKCIIMDEPTATLHRDEINQLFEVVRKIRENGIAVIYISHHLNEIKEIADTFTVLRDGHQISDGVVKNVSIPELVTQMFGSDVTLRRENVHGGAWPLGETILEVNDVHYGRAVRGVSFQVRRGEVLVVTGAVGSGTRELANIAAGAVSPTKGSVKSFGRPIQNRRKATKSGVAFLPSDRKREALMLDRSVSENVLLAHQSTNAPFFHSAGDAHRRSSEVCNELGVKLSDLHAPIRGLSGGNQQKAIIARWVEAASEVLILDDPTVGIDISSKFDIYRRIRGMAGAAKAVIVFSTDFSEIRCIADRVIVMSNGTFVGEISGDEATEHRLFELEMGA